MLNFGERLVELRELENEYHFIKFSSFWEFWIRIKFKFLKELSGHIFFFILTIAGSLQKN